MVNSEQLPVINCDNCGACCIDIGIPPFLQHEIDSLPNDLKLQILQKQRDEQNQADDLKPCSWYENGRCKHYKYRPLVCREFEVGSWSCLSYRQYHNITHPDQNPLG